MAFNSKNPLISPIVEDKPSSPIVNTRGIYPKSDGWYDIDSSGNGDKFVNLNELERLQYYGDKDIIPSLESYFTVNSTGETITGLTDTGKTKTELVIPYKINGVKITAIENCAFYRCSSVTSITIPNSVYNFGSYAVFAECTSLKTINIPSRIRSFDESSFSGCSALTSINIPDSVKYIGANAFSGCTALASIKIPDGASISFNAFSDCTSLTKIEIPNSVTSIGTEAFKGCTSLAIYCEQGSYADTYAKDNNIPIVYTDIKDGLIGKKGINDSSEMFNDINNNIAGSKVFTITAVNDKELTVDLSSLTTEELSTFNSIQAGARCCVDTSTEQDNIKIVSVDGANGKIVVENTVSALEVEDGTIDGDPTHRNYILILDYPNLGNTYDKTINAHAEGENTQALARGAHSEGRDSKAIGQYAHSEGLGTISGYASHAEGRYTKATGNMSHAEGHLTNAYGHNSHSEGRDTTATGYASHAEGNMTEASGAHAHSEGVKTKATGESSHAEGSATEASGAFSHSEGRDTIAQGDYSHAEGVGTKALNKHAHAEGANTQAKGESSHAEGGASVAEGYISHAEGDHTTASGSRSHAEGNSTKATGACSHAEGNQTEAGLQAHAEGDQTKATGETAHAEGRLTEASGASSHAEGKYTKATGHRAHAEGNNTKATNEAAHSEGVDTEASGKASHTEGTGTVAGGDNQHTQGKYNIKDENNKYVHIVGNGTANNERSNAHTIDWNGNAWYAGNVKVGGASYDDANAKELATKEYVNNSVSSAGGGDMLRTVYDKDKTGTVDDSKKLGGQLPSYYAKASTSVVVTLPNTVADWTTNTDENGETYYTKSFSNETFTSDGTPFVGVNYSDTISIARQQAVAYDSIDRVKVTDGSAIFYCFNDVPSVSLDIQIKMVY